MWLNARFISFSQSDVLASFVAGEVHSAFPRVVNINLAGSITSLADIQLGDIPNGVLVDLSHGGDFCESGVKSGMLVMVLDRVIKIPEINLNIDIKEAKKYDEKKRLLEPLLSITELCRRKADVLSLALALAPKDGLSKLWWYAENLLGQKTIGPPLDSSALFQEGYRACQQLIIGIRQDNDRMILHSTSKLSGLGIGLTPSGDDILTGFIASLVIARSTNNASMISERVLDEIVSVTKTQTNPIAWTYLSHARNCAITEKLATFIFALFTHTKASYEEAVKSLFEVGATSGAELALGAYLGACL